MHDAANNLSGDAALRAGVACRAFAIEGDVVDLTQFERGHIHDTWVSTFESNGSRRRYLHQRLNGVVFEDIPCLMHNIERITSFLETRERGENELQALRLVPTHDGAAWLVDAFGQAWRTYHFIENTKSLDVCEGPEQAYDAARVFAEFQSALAQLDVDSLRMTIPHFFSSPYRLQQLSAAARADVRDRVALAEPELAFVHSRYDLVPKIEDALRCGAMRRCVIHGDTKLNNILFDNDSGRAVAVVDLDTCMPGYALFDFGDLVRFTAASSEEDEVDPSKFGTDLEIYRAIVDGWRQGSGGCSAFEVEMMPVAARLVTFTLGMRFLADFLAGDVYFKTSPSRPYHNLERARVQFGMVADMEAKDDEIQRICRG